MMLAGHEITEIECQKAGHLPEKAEPDTTADKQGKEPDYHHVVCCYTGTEIHIIPQIVLLMCLQKLV